MAESKTKLINLRIDLSLFEEYKQFCNVNKTNISSALRKHMRHDLGLIDTVKTVKSNDFRDSLKGSIHGRDPLW